MTAAKRRPRSERWSAQPERAEALAGGRSFAPPVITPRRCPAIESSLRPLQAGGLRKVGPEPLPCELGQVSSSLAYVGPVDRVGVMRRDELAEWHEG